MSTKMFSVRFPKELLRKIDEFRKKQKILPTRSKAIIYLVEVGLKEEVKI